MPTVYSPPVSTYVSLATITLTSTDSEIVFTSIPAGYRDLIMIANQKSTGPATATNAVIRFNSDTGSNYSYVVMYGVGSGSGTSTSGTLTYLDTHNTSTTQFVPLILQIMDYSATDKHKTSLLRVSVAADAVWARATRWASNDAINTVSIIAPDRIAGGTPDSFEIGSTFSLYGIEA